jgi:DNA-binding transcriptional ArsR family regulator
MATGESNGRNSPRAGNGGDGDEAALQSAAEMLRVLSHPARLRIIEILSEGERCVKRIEEVLGIPQPSVSQHLSRLKYAGLIDSERRGHLVCYRLVDGAARDVLEAATGGKVSGENKRRRKKGETG